MFWGHLALEGFAPLLRSVAISIRMEDFYIEGNFALCYFYVIISESQTVENSGQTLGTHVSFIEEKAKHNLWCGFFNFQTWH